MPRGSAAAAAAAASAGAGPASAAAEINRMVREVAEEYSSDALESGRGRLPKSEPILRSGEEERRRTLAQQAKERLNTGAASLLPSQHSIRLEQANIRRAQLPQQLRETEPTWKYTRPPRYYTFQQIKTQIGVNILHKVDPDTHRLRGDPARNDAYRALFYFIFKIHTKLSVDITSLMACEDERCLITQLRAIDSIFFKKVKASLPRKKENIKISGSTTDAAVRDTLLRQIPHTEKRESRDGSHTITTGKYILPDGSLFLANDGTFMITTALHASGTRAGTSVEGAQASLARFVKNYETLWETKKENYFRYRAQLLEPYLKQKLTNIEVSKAQNASTPTNLVAPYLRSIYNNTSTRRRKAIKLHRLILLSNPVNEQGNLLSFRNIVRALEGGSQTRKRKRTGRSTRKLYKHR